jgi:hypothetical protein
MDQPHGVTEIHAVVVSGESRKGEAELFARAK